MRINTVTASHFLSHTTFIMGVPSSIHMTLIAGPNGAGKTAVAQAIRLAIFGDPLRSLTKKNELGELKQHGQKTGIVSVDTDLGVCSLSLSTGKHDPLPAAPTRCWPTRSIQTCSSPSRTRASAPRSS